MEDKVSIILPVYNSEKTIEVTIKSILNQSYKNIELIIINDGSIDGSDKICKFYSEKYKSIIKYFYKIIKAYFFVNNLYYSIYSL